MGIINAAQETPVEEAQDTAPEASPVDAAQDSAPIDESKLPSSDPSTLQGDQGDGQNDEPNVTPEEQAMYDTVMTLALNMMYSKGATAGIIMKLGTGQDNLSQVIGHTAAMIMLSCKRTAAKKGKQIPDDILFHAGQEVLADLVTIAIGSGLMQEAQREDMTKAAALEGMKEVGRALQGENGITDAVQKEAQESLAGAGMKWSDPSKQQAAPQGGPPQGAQPPQGGPPPGPPQGGPTPPQGGIVNAGAQ